MSILSVIRDLIPSIGRTIEKAITDKDVALRLKNEIETLLLEVQSTLVQNKARIIIAEAVGVSWIQRSWRPVTMLTFVFIIANNYILVPYAVAFGLEVPMLDIPPGMWGLLTVGIGGYIGGRTLEKVTELKNGS